MPVESQGSRRRDARHRQLPSTAQCPVPSHISSTCSLLAKNQPAQYVTSQLCSVISNRRTKANRASCPSVNGKKADGSKTVTTLTAIMTSFHGPMIFHLPLLPHSIWQACLGFARKPTSSFYRTAMNLSLGPVTRRTLRRVTSSTTLSPTSFLSVWNEANSAILWDCSQVASWPFWRHADAQDAQVTGVLVC